MLIVAAGSEEQRALGTAQATENTLLLSFDSSPSRVSVALSYQAKRASTGFVEILADCVAHIFSQLANRSSEPVSRLTLIPPEVQAVYLEGSRTIPPSSPDPFVHDLIEKQAQQRPDAVAVVFKDGRVTYAELIVRAKSLASRLRSLGSGPGVLVAIHLGRSIDLVVSILAVLKTGAAFLPLDAWLSAGRVLTVIEDSKAALIITVSTLALRFETVATQVVLLDSSDPIESAAPGHSIFDPLSEEDLAYVIYTSGSTGKPKGVMIEHRNVSALLPAFDGMAKPASGTMLAVSSPSFDMSIPEVLWTLSRGMCIVVHEGDEGSPVFSGPDSIPAQIVKFGVTHLQATPTFMRILAADPNAKEALRTLRVCLLGGEVFPPGLGPALLGSTSASVMNGYGPTETTVCATYHAVTDEMDPMPIGKPMSNSSVYVVDRWNRLVPPLAPGELLIGGPSVGRGYLGNPELTAQRFIPNSFDRADKFKLYRTGDLVCVNLQGSLEFIGRLDFQVKIRGFRIELGEIESALQRFPGVEQAVAVVRSESSGEKSLAAYYTCAPGVEVNSTELRADLTRTLPHYMVPPVLRRLAALPQSRSGKIDRALLAKADTEVLAVVYDSGAETLDRVATGAPADPALARIERQLCSWCSELLRLPNVRPTDDFFEIGGESLIAAQLMRRVSAEYGVNLRLSTLVKARNFRSLAPLLISAQQPTFNSPVIPFRTNGSQTPLFLVAGLGGNVINFDFVSRILTNRPVYGIETHGIGRHGEILPTIESMGEFYLAEIRKIQPKGPYHLAGYSFGGFVAFEMARQLRTAGEEVGLLGLIDTSEWHYRERVLHELSTFDRLDFFYGNTIRQIIFGPDRLGTLIGRIRIARESRRLARAEVSGKQVDASVASVEQRNYFALSRYTPQPYDGSLYLFRTTEETPLRGNDPTLGWAPLCHSINVVDMPGEHLTITSQALAGFLGARLENALLAVEQKLRDFQNQGSAKTLEPERVA